MLMSETAQELGVRTFRGVSKLQTLAQHSTAQPTTAQQSSPLTVLLSHWVLLETYHGSI